MSSFQILTCCRAPTPWAARGLKRAEPTSTRAPGRPKTSFISLPPHALRVSGNRTRIFQSKVQPATSAPPRRAGRNELIMVHYKWGCISARSTQERIQGGAKICHRVSLINKLLLQTGRLQQPTECIAVA